VGSPRDAIPAPIACGAVFSGSQESQENRGG